MKKRSGKLARIGRTIILLAVIAALGAVFYFGYYQFQLPADTYAVIFTKLNNWSSETVTPGTFRFEWEGLIPLNLRMEKFTLQPRTVRLSSSGNLPSAESYRLYLENNPDFSYAYSFDITYTVRASSLPNLVSEEFLRSGTFDDWISDFETGLSADASGLVRQLAEDYDYMNKISYNYQLMEDDLKESLSDKYNYIEFVRFTPVEIIFPDLSLYAEGRRQYFLMESYHNDIQKAALKESSTRLVEESAKLDLLQKYGELFTRYPKLIEYYSIFQADGAGLVPSMELPSAGSGSEAFLQPAETLQQTD